MGLHFAAFAGSFVEYIKRSVEMRYYLARRSGFFLQLSDLGHDVLDELVVGGVPSGWSQVGLGFIYSYTEPDASISELRHLK